MADPSAFARLVEIMARLRGPGGCPWDLEQTHASLQSYLLEEAYETLEAIDRADDRQLCQELGDLLLQVVFHAQIASEEEHFGIEDVCRSLADKLIRRHPHIFADAVADTGAEVKARWERIKVELEGREGIFHDVAAGSPALLYARKLQQRAAAVGFDWESAAEAFPKIAEEHAELAEVLGLAACRPEGVTEDRSAASGFDSVPPSDPSAPPSGPPAAAPAPDKARLNHEFGDLLFAVVNVARLTHVDPELALREAARRFERRVCSAAALAKREGRDWSALGLDEQERYYQVAKAQEGPS